MFAQIENLSLSWARCGLLMEKKNCKSVTPRSSGLSKKKKQKQKQKKKKKNISYATLVQT